VSTLLYFMMLVMVLIFVILKLELFSNYLVVIDGIIIFVVGVFVVYYIRIKRIIVCSILL